MTVVIPGALPRAVDFYDRSYPSTSGNSSRAHYADPNDDGFTKCGLAISFRWIVVRDQPATCRSCRKINGEEPYVQ